MSKQARKIHELHNVSVRELIDLLSEYPSDMLVGVDGYEGGTTAYLTVSVIDRKLVPTMPSWEGEYQHAFSKTDSVKMLSLSRGERPTVGNE